MAQPANTQGNQVQRLWAWMEYLTLILQQQVWVVPESESSGHMDIYKQVCQPELPQPKEL